jgi:hypothetical protein
MADKSKRPRTDTSGSEAVADSQSGRTWYFAVTKKTYSSLESYYDAVVYAQRSGKAPYWRLVDVRKDVALQTVQLVCLECDKAIPARNPADAAKKHFQRNEDGSLFCKESVKKQACIDIALQLAPKHQSSGSFSSNVLAFMCW